MALHRGHGDRELAADTGVGAALGDLGHRLPLARGQVVEGAGFRLRPISRATTSGSSADSPAATPRTVSANVCRSPTFLQQVADALSAVGDQVEHITVLKELRYCRNPVGACIRTPRCLRRARGRFASSWPGTAGHHASPESVARAGHRARAEEPTGHSIAVYVPVAAASHSLCPTANARHHPT